MKQKILSLLVLLMTAASGAWAAKDVIPSDAVLGEYYNPGDVCVCIYVPDNTNLYGIVFTGSYNGWSTNIALCNTFKPVENYEGWYVTSFEAEADPDGEKGMQGLPVRLDANGKVSMDYAAGAATAIRGGVQVVQGAAAGKIELITFGADGPNVLSIDQWNGDFAAFDHVFSVAESEHGSGTVKFFVDEKEVKGANEGDVITMTVTPDEGYVVGSVSANAYTTWAGARRTAPTIPMLGNVTLTPVEGKANTWTFTMPAANVELKIGYLATSNLYLSKDALADKANITVKDGETAVEFDDEGKSTTTVIEGNTVTTKYNGTKKILGMKVAKKGAKTITIGDVELIYADGDTWETIVSKNSDKIKTLSGRYIVQVAQSAPNQYKYLNVWSTTVKPSDIIDPSKNYQWSTLEVYS